MKILEDFIERMDSTLEEAETYITKAHLYKNENKKVADAYANASETHLNLYMKMHETVVALINEERRKGVSVHVGMMEAWNLQHSILVKKFTKLKYLVDEYGKSY